MDRRYIAAKLEMMLIFLLLCVISIVSLGINPEFDIEFVFSVFFCEIIITGILIFVSNFKSSIIVYAVVYHISYVAASVFICAGFNNWLIVLPLLVISTYLMVPLYNFVIVVIQLLVDITVISGMYFYHPLISDKPDDNAGVFIFALICLFVTTWMIYISILYVSKRERMSMEQQQSLDDLIKVVEVKCVEARAAAKSKTTFLANISHELRTPLNAILGMNSLIERDSLDAKIHEYADCIDANGKELLRKINDILDYSLIDSGNFKLSEEEYESLFLFNDVTVTTRQMMENKKFEFRACMEDSVPKILYGDVSIVKKVIMSLISNSIKYTEEGFVELKVSGKRENESDYADIIIEVSDTGCGINEEDFARIFESFNTYNDDKKYVSGTGIGLSMTKSLLELMGGNISFTSEAGKGSVFTVSVPQKVISNDNITSTSMVIESVKRNKLSDESSLFDGVSLLVVDDVAVNLKVFKGLLKKTKAKVDTANGGEGAISLVSDNKYDIIFLDHMMPNMDGVETLNAILKIPGFSIEDTPVIVLTANAISGAKEDYLKDGFVDYMSKPLKKDELFEIIEKYTLRGSQEEEYTEAYKEADNHNGYNKQSQNEKELSIDSLSFLDIKEGLRNCDGDEELYLDVVKEYYISERTNEMESFYTREEWKNYEILVHALKSTSKSIGAISLSNAAKGLEQAAKNGDTDFIKAHHKEVYDEYRNLVVNIGKVITKDDNLSKTTEDRTGKHLIYVVDDDKVNLKVAEGILNKHFAVDTFINGYQVLDAIDRRIPNLILLDIKMPELSGFDVIEKIHNNSRWKNIPVIFMTADDDTDTEIKGFKEGAMDFIKKPFSPQIMLERINRILELNQLKNYLESEVDRKTGKVAKLSLQAMETLAMTIDAKDKYTNGHSTRVAKYSRMIAERIGYSPEDLQTIYYMGLLHDIGKIGVPDTIINKDGKLTDEEFAQIKKHPETGYGILKNITEIPDIEKGARYHHERYDGKGYPDGLKGVEIPLFARIIAVADSYDAMTSKRSYRDVLPQDYVRSELIKGKGTQFDPALADIMVKMMDEDLNYILKEH